jgi:hypothetical protein
MVPENVTDIVIWMVGGRSTQPNVMKTVLADVQLADTPQKVDAGDSTIHFNNSVKPCVRDMWTEGISNSNIYFELHDCRDVCLVVDGFSPGNAHG